MARVRRLLWSARSLDPTHYCCLKGAGKHFLREGHQYTLVPSRGWNDEQEDRRERIECLWLRCFCVVRFFIPFCLFLSVHFDNFFGFHSFFEILLGRRKTSINGSRVG